MSRSSRLQSNSLKIFSVIKRESLSADDIGLSIYERCESLTKDILSAYGIKSFKAQDNRVEDILNKIENGTIYPKKYWSYEFNLVQKKYYDDQLNFHFEIALQQVLYAVFIWENCFPILGNKFSILQRQYIEKEKIRLIRDMLTAIDHSNRHLTALCLVENLKNKNYERRAEKGGNARSKPLTEKEKGYLLWVVVKGMLYNDPQSIRRFRNSPLHTVHEFAVRIKKANKEYQMLDIAELDSLESDIQTIFIERRDEISTIEARYSNKNINKGLVRPRLKPYAEKKELETAESQGCIKGLQEALVILLISRFGKLQGQVLDNIYRTGAENELRKYLKLVSQAKSLDEVIPTLF